MAHFNLYLLVIFISLVSLQCYSAAPEITKRAIAGGFPSTADRRFYVRLTAQVRRHDTNGDFLYRVGYFGGTLIHELFVLTAAFVEPTDVHTIDTIIADVGDFRNAELVRQHQVFAWYYHYNGFRGYADHDLALLRLSEPVNISMVTTLDLCHNYEPPHDRFRMVGMGSLQPITGDYPDVLQEAEMKISNAHPICVQFFRQMENSSHQYDLTSVECTMAANPVCNSNWLQAILLPGDTLPDTFPCQGDIGNPGFAAGWFDHSAYCLYGILTETMRIDGVKGQASLFTKVEPFWAWINEIIYRVLNNEEVPLTLAAMEHVVNMDPLPPT